MLYLLSLITSQLHEYEMRFFNSYFELCLICSFLGNYELLQAMENFGHHQIDVFHLDEYLSNRVIHGIDVVISVSSDDSS